MKRPNFLGWMAGALVAAWEAFVGDVDTEEPLTIPPRPKLAPLVADPNVSTFPPAPRVVLTQDGRTFEGKLISWSGTTYPFDDKIDVVTKYEYREVKAPNEPLEKPYP